MSPPASPCRPASTTRRKSRRAESLPRPTSGLRRRAGRISHPAHAACRPRRGPRRAVVDPAALLWTCAGLSAGRSRASLVVGRHQKFSSGSGSQTGRKNRPRHQAVKSPTFPGPAFARSTLQSPHPDRRRGAACSCDRRSARPRLAPSAIIPGPNANASHAACVSSTGDHASAGIRREGRSCVPGQPGGAPKHSRHHYRAYPSPYCCPGRCQRQCSRRHHRRARTEPLFRQPRSPGRAPVEVHAGHHRRPRRRQQVDDRVHFGQDGTTVTPTETSP